MKTMICALLFLFMSSISQHKKETFSCDKVEVLFETVFTQKIYIFTDGDDFIGPTYLVSNSMIPEGKIFTLKFDTIIAIDKNNQSIKNYDFLDFDYINFNDDTTFVKLSIFFSSKKGAMLTSRLEFKLDIDSCKWELQKISHINY